VAKISIERHPQVLAKDLPSIYGYIAQDNPEAADRVLEAIQKTFEQIAQQPDVGVIYRTRNTKLQSIRMLPVSRFPQYLVFYRMQTNTVRILYVLHGAQHIVRLFQRKPRT